MRVLVDFEALVTFDCTYGRWTVEGDSLRVFVEKGLVLPHCKLVDDSNGASLAKCEKGESSRVEHLFPVHYIYDAAKQAEYDEWESVDGLLRGRSQGGEWVQYLSKSESSYAMHEFVGGCWFVFVGISYSKSTVIECAKDRKSSTGLKVMQELASPCFLSVSSKSFSWREFSMPRLGLAGCLGRFMPTHSIWSFLRIDISALVKKVELLVFCLKNKYSI